MLGDNVYIQFPFSEQRFVIFFPFKSLQWVIGAYGIIFITSFIIFIIGTFMLSQSVMCGHTAPVLYKFTSFLVVSWWLIFFVIIGYLVKLYFGHDISSFISEQTREHTDEEMEERIFRKVFNEFDKDREGMNNIIIHNHICIYIYICVIYMYMYVCMYVCGYINISIAQ